MPPFTPVEVAPARSSSGIQRYFEIALFLLVFTSFITLVSTGGLDAASVSLVSAALVFRGYLLWRRSSWLLSERWTGILTVAYVAFYVADYLLLSGGFLNATVHLVLFVLVVRLFSAQRDRDFYFLAVIAFLMVLAAALLTVDGVFLAAFVAFLLAAVVAFILMEIRHASRAAKVYAREETGGTASLRKLAGSLLMASPVLVVSIFAAAAAIFFVLPRVSAGYLSAYAPGGDLATGFSDEVQLGRIGEIQQSSALVMHIQIEGDAQGRYDLKWRGISLSNFDGRTWSNNHESRPVRQSFDGRFVLSAMAAGAPKVAPRLIHYRVLMEPVGTNVFFLADRAQILEGGYRRVAMDGGGAVFDLDPERPVSRYQATSDVAQPEAEDLRREEESTLPGGLAGYLKLPELDPRIAQLARQITERAGNNYDKAVALETYLQTRFLYTLQLPRRVPHDPLANFLFERKQGHCEYFASSMAVMLRTLGIPSRVVNGFRTGEFNDVTSQYVVRARDAHSWVEAYFPGYGWVAFDPTPGAALPVRSGWGRVMLYVDAMRSWWRDWVVDYDATHQRMLAMGAQSSGRQLVQELRQWWRSRYESLLAAARRTQGKISASPRRWSLGSGLAVALLLLAANGKGLWRELQRRRLAGRPEKSPRAAATIWYERMTEAVAKRGWQRSPAQTPREFVLRIEDATVREKVAEFTRCYQSARFADSAQDVRRLPELYAQIVAPRGG